MLILFSSILTVSMVIFRRRLGPITPRNVKPLQRVFSEWRDDDMVREAKLQQKKRVFILIQRRQTTLLLKNSCYFITVNINIYNRVLRWDALQNSCFASVNASTINQCINRQSMHQPSINASTVNQCIKYQSMNQPSTKCINH